MPRTRVIQNNFTGGEFTPRLHARQEFGKYANALATLENFSIYPHGGCTRRNGSRFVNETKLTGSFTRLIPFEFSVSQAYVIEMGHLYMRFYTLSGRLDDPPGTPVELVTPYLSTELSDIQYAQSADILYLVHANHQPRKLSRTSATTFTLTEINFRDGPYLDQNSEHDHQILVSGTSGTIFLTATGGVGGGHEPFTPAHVGSSWRVDLGYGWGWVRILSFVSTRLVTAEVIETFGEYFSIPANDDGHSLRDDADAHRLAQGVKFENDTVLGHIELFIRRTAEISSGDVWVEIRQADQAALNPLKDAIDVSKRIPANSIPPTAGYEWIVFEFDRIRPGNPSSPILSRGTLYYIVLCGDYQSGTGNLIQWRKGSPLLYEDGSAWEESSTTGVWTDLASSFAVRNASTDDWREPAWSDQRGWPSAVGFFEQRLYYGKDVTFYGSVINDFDTFSPTFGGDPPSDENAVTFTIASTQVNTIQWIAGIDELFIGTAGSEYRIIGSNESGITPNNPPLVREVSSYGSARIRPIKVGKNLVYVGRSRTKLREIAFNLSEDSYMSLDLLLLSEHIGKRQFTDFVYVQDPDSTIMGVMQDGSIAAAVYLKSQDVIGWSNIRTDGDYKSLAVIPHPSGDSSQVWVIVSRATGSGAIRQYVEYFEDRGGEYGPLHVDSGLSYSGPETDTLSGLSHLEGKIVNIVGNMAVYSPRAVSGGAVTGLYPPVSRADVGLPYTSRLKDLRPALNTQQGTLYALPIGPAETTVTLLESLGLNINGDVVPFRQATDPIDVPPPIYTGEKDVRTMGWDRDAQVLIEQTQPLPCTVLAITRTLEVGEA